MLGLGLTIPEVAARKAAEPVPSLLVAPPVYTPVSSTTPGNPAPASRPDVPMTVGA